MPNVLILSQNTPFSPTILLQNTYFDPTISSVAMTTRPSRKSPSSLLAATKASSARTQSSSRLQAQRSAAVDATASNGVTPSEDATITADATHEGGWSAETLPGAVATVAANIDSPASKSDVAAHNVDAHASVKPGEVTTVDTDGDGAGAAGNKVPTPASTSASSGGAGAETIFGSVTLTLDTEDANAGPTLEVETDEHVKPAGKKPNLAVGANVRPSSTDDARLVGTDDLADVKQKAFRAAVAAV